MKDGRSWGFQVSYKLNFSGLELSSSYHDSSGIEIFISQTLKVCSFLNILVALTIKISRAKGLNFRVPLRSLPTVIRNELNILGL